MPIDYSKFDGVGDTDSEEEAKDEPRFTAGDADELIRGLATRSMAEKMNAMTPLPKSDAAIEEAKRTPENSFAFENMGRARIYAAQGDKENALVYAGMSLLSQSQGGNLDGPQDDGTWRPFENFLFIGANKQHCASNLSRDYEDLMCRINSGDLVSVPIGGGWWRSWGWGAYPDRICYLAQPPWIHDQQPIAEPPPRDSLLLECPRVSCNLECSHVVLFCSHVVLGHLSRLKEERLKAVYHLVVAARLMPGMCEVRRTLAEHYVFAEMHDVIVQDECMCSMSCQLDLRGLSMKGQGQEMPPRPDTNKRLRASLVVGQLYAVCGKNLRAMLHLQAYMSQVDIVGVDDEDPELERYLGTLWQAYRFRSLVDETEGFDSFRQSLWSRPEISRRVRAVYPRLSKDGQDRHRGMFVGHERMAQQLEEEERRSAAITAAAATPPAPPPRPPKEERQRLRRICDVCGRTGPIGELCFPVCDNCSSRRYCGLECQRVDWDHGHREQCARLAEGN